MGQHAIGLPQEGDVAEGVARNGGDGGPWEILRGGGRGKCQTAVGAEDLELVGGLAHAREDDGRARDLLDAQRSAPAGVAVELREDDAAHAEAIVRKSLDIAAEICVYTNRNVTIEMLKG